MPGIQNVNIIGGQLDSGGVTLLLSSNVTPTGEWNSSTSYIIGDAVTFEGSGYLAVAASTNQSPPNTSYWQTLGSKGDPGEPGEPGSPGADGADGADGVVASVVAGTGIAVDSTDPANPVVSAASHTHAAADTTSGTFAPARLGSGTADNTTFLRGDGSWEVPSGGGGGQSTFDMVIAADASGDYTDLATGLNAAASGDRIFVKPGTYTLTSALNMTANSISLIGADRETTIISLGTNYFGLAGTANLLKELRFNTTSGYIYVQGGTDDTEITDCNFYATPSGSNRFVVYGESPRTVIDNCKLIITNGTATTFMGFQIPTAGSVIRNCYFEGTTTGGGGSGYLACTETFKNCNFKTTANSSGNVIRIASNTSSMVTDCRFYSENGTGCTAIDSAASPSTIVSCSFIGYKQVMNPMGTRVSFTGNYVSAYNTSGAVMLETSGGSDCSITGNTFIGNSSVTGVRIENPGCTVTGNTFTGLGVGIDIVTGVTGAVIVGNNGSSNTDGILDNGSSTVLAGNGIS